jgi:predicted permease
MSVREEMAFYGKLRARLEALPGVRSVAVASDPAIGFHRYARTVRVGSNTLGAATFSPVTSVTHGYFETTDILLLRGRDFSPGEGMCCRLEAIVSESAARQFFGEGNPVGRRFRLFGDPSDRVIVGVARDTSYSELGSHDRPLIYVPIGQDPPVVATFHIRTAGDPALMTGRIEKEIRAMEPRLPAPEVRTVTEALEDARWTRRMGALLLSVFGLLAMLLAMMGVYGVTSHAVKQRTGEIGARMALGALPVDVTQLIFRQASALVLPGLAIGGAGAFILAARYDKMLLGVRQTDLEPYLAAAALLMAAAILATWLPARRAVKMQPAAALRQE